MKQLLALILATGISALIVGLVVIIRFQKLPLLIIANYLSLLREEKN